MDIARTAIAAALPQGRYPSALGPSRVPDGTDDMAHKKPAKWVPGNERKRRAGSAADWHVELASLGELDLSALRMRWLQVTGKPAPKGFRRAFLMAALAHELQVVQHAGLSPTTRKHLRLLATAAREGRFEEALGVGVLKPGTVLVRLWQGTAHRVTVANKGFIWNGQAYATLSGIAKAITGTSWNGWTFFGLPRPVMRNKNAAKATQVMEIAHASGP